MFPDKHAYIKENNTMINDIWHSEPEKGAIEIDLTGYDFIVELFDEDKHKQGEFIVKAMDDTKIKKGKKNKYANGLKFAMPIINPNANYY
jgi:hypothetical protein